MLINFDLNNHKFTNFDVKTKTLTHFDLINQKYY